MAFNPWLQYAERLTVDVHNMAFNPWLQYAERLPIGKEDIIQGIPAAKVLAFYKRWYRPENMAIIAVGDFADPQAVVGMIEHHMAKCQASGSQAEPVPRLVSSYLMLDLLLCVA